ncbi:MAG TPA: GcrA family cell cycle regulator [Micropepsaceae bacterium]|nr:GcrA family cell cycle regulator [Micropepsaceae bacterium]
MTQEDEFMERAGLVLDNEAGLDGGELGGTDNLPALPLPSAVKTRKRKVITTLTLSSRTCKWPIGDPARSDFHYCGDLPQPGRVYCGTHESMSYQPMTRRK